jgi:hypothetical protein
VKTLRTPAGATNSDTHHAPDAAYHTHRYILFVTLSPLAGAHASWWGAVAWMVVLASLAMDALDAFIGAHAGGRCPCPRREANSHG